MIGDVLSREDDRQAGEPLIRPVMRAGRRLAPSPSLAEIRAYAAQGLQRLPEGLHGLGPGTSYPVEVADALVRLAADVDRRLAESRR